MSYRLINVLLGDEPGGPSRRLSLWSNFGGWCPLWSICGKGRHTGWAQVNGLRGDTSIVERTKYDLLCENWSLLFDLKIIVRSSISCRRQTPTVGAPGLDLLG